MVFMMSFRLVMDSVEVFIILRVPPSHGLQPFCCSCMVSSVSCQYENYNWLSLTLIFTWSIPLYDKSTVHTAQFENVPFEIIQLVVTVFLFTEI